jgi:hypothetical protein
MRYLTRILAFFLFLILLFPRLSYSQTDTLSKPSIPFYKNSLKGMPTFLPIIVIGVYAGVSLGYERYLTKHHSLELCSYYYFNTDEMGAWFHTFAIMPGYKFFSVSEKERYNNFWISAYLSYMQSIQTLSEEGHTSDWSYYYGIGISVGKKIKISKNHKWFIDIGFGITYNQFFDESIFSDSSWEDKFSGHQFNPRPILQFGRKF